MNCLFLSACRIHQGGTDAKSEKKIKLLTEQAATLKKTIQENQDKIRQMEKDLKEAKSGGTADVSPRLLFLLARNSKATLTLRVAQLRQKIE